MKKILKNITRLLLLLSGIILLGEGKQHVLVTPYEQHAYSSTSSLVFNTGTSELEVILESDTVDNLLDVFEEYIRDRDLETAEIAVREVLATFFELSYSQINDDFLKNHTLNDFHSKILGSKHIYDLDYGVSDFDISFYNLLNNLEKNENQFYKNIQESFKNIDSQRTNEISMITVDEEGDGRIKVYYLVPYIYLDTFKELTTK